MILDPQTVEQDLALTADVCVVGSGVGGAVVARALARAGRAVVVVDEGPYLTSRDFTQREEQMLPRLYGAEYLRTDTDVSVLVPQARVLGGSAVPGLCVCMRTPTPLLEHWERTHGLRDLGPAAVTPFFERAESLANVQPLQPGDVNANNARLQLGAERLGYRYRLAKHNRTDCVGCGFCTLGCSYDRKVDALTVHLPEASRAGAIIVPGCRVDQVETRAGGVVGVRGHFVRAERPAALRVEAPVVVLAAGAIGSPAIWLRSELPNRYKQVGRNLHLHPTVALGALFDEDIAGWRGIPRSVVVDQFLDLEHAILGGYLLMPTFAHPVAMAAALPGLGQPYYRLVGDYARLALAEVMLHDRSAGRVELDTAGHVSITYQLNDEDRADLQDGMRRLADVFFAAGARRVVLPYNELVELTRVGDYRAIDERPVRSTDPLLVAYHPQGTLRMGVDPRAAVVDAWGQAYDVRGLFVADASVFPTSNAVPPQLAITAFALRTAESILAHGA